ncbi:galactose-binding domain-containing protein [Nonomuraea roseola]|uniref:Discoidin domain-containing protein n=1 Tax=Nonomuraea roseola TaxID=46179 RepID=A0ABV5PRL1_9ACTN
MRRTLALLAALALAVLGHAPPAWSAGPNLAAGKQVSASSHTDVYPAGRANDGDQATYWESANNAFPQWIQVDLGSAVSVNEVVLKLPSSWQSRTQTLTVQGSTDGSTFTTLSASAARTFAPTATITFAQAGARYVRVTITANTGWPAGQLSEFEVYGPVTGPDTQAPTAPGDLTYTEPSAGQIRLAWQASTDNVGVTGYDVYANNALRGTVAENTVTYTDSQPAGATVSYHVRAKDAAGNRSPDSNTVTRQGSGGGGANLAQGKPVTASGSTWVYTPGNANDGDLTTYWEGGGGYPNTLTVQLGSNADVSSVVLKLNPDSAWGARTQTLQVLGREQGSSAFTSLKSSASYAFSPSSGNTVSIPVSGRVADVRLSFTANTGAPNGQVAEFQVVGVPAPNPDLTITGMTVSPGAPVESDAITLSATVRNAGTQASTATNVTFYLGTTKVGTANVGALAAGASATVSSNIGTRTAGTYAVSAKVDEADSVVEQNETNNAHTHPAQLVVKPVDSADLVASPVGWTPGNPARGDTVTFTVAIKNQGNVASASGAHGITLTVANEAGTVVKTLTGAHNGVVNAGATTAPVTLGTWTAADGKYTVKTVVADDANELPVKRANNTTTQPLFVGRGASLPYDMYEAEDGALGGGAQLVGPNRTIGDLAGEASGRRAVTLDTTGASVEFTTKAAANTLVTRFSIPDGTTSTLNVYVDGTFLKAINLTSKHAWLYGKEDSPSNSPGAGAPRHIYDEANLVLGTTVAKGSRIRLQKDAANSGTFAIDFINLELATALPNPDPARYAVPAGFTHQDVQNALDRARQDANLVGVYLPPGDYPTAQKFQVYGKAVKVAGAGPWFTRFVSPVTQENTDVGFRVESSANGSSFGGFASFGNYTTRNDGPGKVWDLAGVSNVTMDNIWVEHQMCMFWGANVHNITITNSRIRDTFADGVNMTNGSTNNTVRNVEARSTGDDSFALFAATDSNNADQTGNVYENLTATLTWRAAGLAVYGGSDNVFRNIYIADMLVYSGITISSLDFGYPMRGFGTTPTRFENISLVRAGGHFWGNQTFPAIWLFSASKVFQGIRISNVDIVDPTYSGIMFQTQYLGGRPVNPITDTVLTNVSITGARKSGDAFDAKSGFGIWANELPEDGQGPAVGSATFNGLRMSDNHTDVRNTTSTFTITVN